MYKDDGVTVIVSTHNRPNVLKYCLQSVIYQTYKNWIIYVIGDDCDGRTEFVINEINNPKIRYYNNPLRFGEQSGCNNIGIALTKTKFIAFLNHDDIWTPDHLEKAIIHLERYDFYISRSIFSDSSIDGIPRLKLISSKNRTTRWIFRTPWLFEPCSSWVINTETIRKIGYWKQCLEIHRSPIDEFIIRSWRKRIKMFLGDNISCIKCGYYQGFDSGKPLYDYEGKEIEYILQVMSNEKLRKKLIDDESNFIQLDGKVQIIENGKFHIRRLFLKLLINPVAYFYYLFNLDFFEIYLSLNFLKGYSLSYLVKIRTGEFQIVKQSLEDAIERAKKSNKLI